MNSFGFNVNAERFVLVGSDTQIAAVCSLARKKNWPLFVLGAGSNLVLSKDIPGLVVQLGSASISYQSVGDRHAHQYGSPDKSTSNSSLHSRQSEAVDEAAIVCADAGVNWHQLVLDTLDNGYGGLENLSLIPGTAGAAPVQNIGAYGVEFCDLLDSLDAYHRPTSRWLTLNAADCRFSYRDSLFKQHPGDYIIARLRLRLHRHSPINTSYSGLHKALLDAGKIQPKHQDISRAVCQLRRQKLPDPAIIGNAGSFFKNPIVSADKAKQLRKQFPAIASFELADGQFKIAAAWLIDSLGYKGIRRGFVGVHDRQALVLVHEGGATGEQLMQLAFEIIEAVKTRYELTLVPEPVML